MKNVIIEKKTFKIMKPLMMVILLFYVNCNMPFRIRFRDDMIIYTEWFN